MSCNGRGDSDVECYSCSVRSKTFADVELEENPIFEKFLENSIFELARILSIHSVPMQFVSDGVLPRSS